MEMQRSLKTRLGAVYPVKGSELRRPNSPWNGLEVRNATVLYEIWSNKQIMKCYDGIYTSSIAKQVRIAQSKG